MRSSQPGLTSSCSGRPKSLSTPLPTHNELCAWWRGGSARCLCWTEVELYRSLRPKVGLILYPICLPSGKVPYTAFPSSLAASLDKNPSSSRTQAWHQLEPRHYCYSNTSIWCRLGLLFCCGGAGVKVSIWNTGADWSVFGRALWTTVCWWILQGCLATHYPCSFASRVLSLAAGAVVIYFETRLKHR